MPNTLPTTCDGLIVIPTEDGPEYSACTKRGCPCKARQLVKARITATGDPFLGAATAELADEEF